MVNYTSNLKFMPRNSALRRKKAARRRLFDEDRAGMKSRYCAVPYSAAVSEEAVAIAESFCAK
jgi:hypothetical protein